MIAHGFKEGFRVNAKAPEVHGLFSYTGMREALSSVSIVVLLIAYIYHL